MTDELKVKLRKSAQRDLLELSCIPRVYWDEIKLYVPDEDVEAYERLSEIKSTILDISEPDIDMKNLLICSDRTGNGKTSWALKILQYFIFKSAQSLYFNDEDNSYGYFVTTSKFVSLSKEYDNQRRQKFYEMQDMIEKSRVVVFDDIAVGEYSRAEYMALYTAIEDRILNHKFCIFTSNFVDKDSPVLIDRLGARLVDRIYCTSEKIILHGEGVRH